MRRLYRLDYQLTTTSALKQPGRTRDREEDRERKRERKRERDYPAWEAPSSPIRSNDLSTDPLCALRVALPRPSPLPAHAFISICCLFLSLSLVSCVEHSSGMISAAPPASSIAGSSSVFWHANIQNVFAYVDTKMITHMLFSLYVSNSTKSTQCTSFPLPVDEFAVVYFVLFFPSRVSHSTIPSGPDNRKQKDAARWTETISQRLLFYIFFFFQLESLFWTQSISFLSSIQELLQLGQMEEPFMCQRLEIQHALQNLSSANG